MKIKNLTKEELELMSYNDIAYLLLKEASKETSTVDLFKSVCDLLGLTKKEYENKIGGFYTSLTTDQRFLVLDSGNWDLKENHSVKSLKINELIDDIDDVDPEDVYDDLEDEEEIKEDSYDDNDELEDDPAEDYKDLVIVDEEDLDNLE